MPTNSEQPESRWQLLAGMTFCVAFSMPRLGWLLFGRVAGHLPVGHRVSVPPCSAAKTYTYDVIVCERLLCVNSRCVWQSEFLGHYQER